MRAHTGSGVRLVDNDDESRVAHQGFHYSFGPLYLYRFMPTLRTLVIGFVLAAVAIGGFVVTRDGEREPPYIALKPDPQAGIPEVERPGFIRANEGCEPGLGGAFVDESRGFEARLVLSGLEAPTVLEFLDDSVAFIGQRDGIVKRWDLVTGEVETVIDLSAETANERDQGLLGLAVTPDARHLLMQYTTTDDTSKIVAQPLDDGVPRLTGRLDVLTVEQPSAQHNGGTIAFDANGMLWASFGDGGGQGDNFSNAQDPTTPLGSILRLAVDLDDLSVSGAPGNPYLDSEEGHPWVFATGIRNPFRFSIDPVTGEVWIGDVGQACVEEVSVVDPSTDAAANLGWAVYEGNRPFLGELAGEHHAPVFDYGRQGGFCAVVGGEVYRGSAIEGLEGSYVFTDYCGSEIMVLEGRAGPAVRTGVEIQSPLDVTADPSGELFVVSMLGDVFELVPAG